MPTKRDNSIYCAKEWMSPTGDGASDYYNAGAGRHAGVPRNVFGRQKPHSGNAYAGICIRKGFIEYLQTKLKETLVKDQDYLVEFYVSRAEHSIGSVKEFGVLFAKKMIIGHNGIGINSKPAAEMIKTSGFRNKKNWIKVSLVYHAQGFENMLILGYFNHDKSKKFRGYTHYYVDDVSVTLIEKKVDSIVTEMPEEPIIKSFSPKIGEAIALENVFFPTNKSELLPESFPELDKLILYLSESPRSSIFISGHTDPTGNEEQNKSLSEARAKAVAQHLILKGIESSRITYQGFGSYKPVATNDTDAGRQQNRRVEFTILENNKSD
ncbi:MAG: OmpA family protein [Bacteroidota bacterium]|nr:OmpA family protein [Bacteroidota bacterium]